MNGAPQNLADFARREAQCASVLECGGEAKRSRRFPAARKQTKADTFHSPVRRAKAVTRHRTWSFTHLLALLLILFTNRPLRLAGAETIKSSPEPLAPGVVCWHEQSRDPLWSIQVVRVELGRPELRWATTLARDTVLGLEPLSSQISRLPRDAGHPLAGVNADFFVITLTNQYRGDPLGLQLWQGEWVSRGAGRPAVWFSTSGRPQLGEVTEELTLSWADVSLPLALNERPPGTGAALFTSRFGNSTRTIGGLELTLVQADERELPALTPGSRLELRASAVSTNGNTLLSPRNWVVSLDHALTNRLRLPHSGDTVTLRSRLSPDLSGVTAAIGGWPVLLRDGRPLDRSSPRHPRTALGWDDRHLWLVVVDGRQAEHSVGMDFRELTALMQRLGCREAVNLDGGGSSTLWAGGRVRNSPSDGRERAVANGLVLLQSGE